MDFEKKGLDLDRGLIQQSHPAGFVVSMYFDDPGVWLDVHGKELPDQVAEAAGFDVAKYQKQAELVRNKQLAVEALTRIDGQDVHEVKKKVGDYSLVHIGHDRYVVENVDGEQLIRPTSFVAATAVIDAFGSQPEPEPEQVPLKFERAKKE